MYVENVKEKQRNNECKLRIVINFGGKGGHTGCKWTARVFILIWEGVLGVHCSLNYIQRLSTLFGV